MVVECTQSAMYLLKEQNLSCETAYWDDDGDDGSFCYYKMSWKEDEYHLGCCAVYSSESEYHTIPQTFQRRSSAVSRAMCVVS
jgi:monoamine oxidase